MSASLNYLAGFGNHFESEAVKNALVKSKNSPQKPPYGLYAEQINGSAFTAPRNQNLFSWLYRIQPSVMHGEFIPYEQVQIKSDNNSCFTPPTQMRWDPLPLPKENKHFIDSLVAFAINGSFESQSGGVIYLYSATMSMDNVFAYNADGDFLIVPQEGSLRIRTEMGSLDISPHEIAVIPRGIKFQILLLNDYAKGYVCENFGAPFKLPDLGVIGANGLANPRDFLSPCAQYEEIKGNFTLIVKFRGDFWQAPLSHSPLDVVAWHGNYVPYKYNLNLFNTINTVSFDHPDPSIFTVLTSPSVTAGVGNIDFVIFPPRWMVAEQTFRPPYYHRNIMSEFMGLISGEYDAKKTGFIAGGASLHNCFTAHGPDFNAFTQASHSTLKPEYYANTLAFMFESRHIWQVTKTAYYSPHRQKNYLDCWKKLPRQFRLSKSEAEPTSNHIDMNSKEITNG